MTTRAPHRPESSSTLETRLAEAEEMLRAIRHGEVDALVVDGPEGSHVYTLHSAEEPYRTLVEQMQEGALVLTGRGDIVYANARFAALVGEPLEALVGSRLDRFVLETDRHDVEDLISRGSGRCSAPGRAGLTAYRGEPVAHHHEIPDGRSTESDCDGSQRSPRGARQPGRRPA